MPEQPRDLWDSRSVVLDGSGYGTVQFGPDRPNTRWVITRVSLQVASNVAEPEGRIYRSRVSPGLMLSGTFSGSNDTDDGLNETVYPGDFLVVEWTGGDAGATATAAFFGQEISGVA